MNGTHILNHIRDHLAEEVLARGNDLPPFRPLNITPWLAMSLMQKSIRRGRMDFALQAAATLLKVSPERLWRRLGVIAFEDIGVGDWEAVLLVTAGLKGKTWRAEVGGEWAVASYLVTRMCRAIKCRGTDDLYVACEDHPAFERTRLDLTFQPIPRLLDRIAGRGALPERALALWFAIGTARCRSSMLRDRRGEPGLVLDALCERGFPDTVVEVAREGLRKTGEIIAPFTILLWRELQRAARHAEPDDIPSESMVGNVPGWALDMFVREGKAAQALFLKSSCETTRWIKEHVPAAGQRKLLGNMVFRVESQVVDLRLRWDVGDRLRRMADLEASGLAPEDMTEGLALLRRDLPILDEMRRRVVFRG